MWGVNPFSRASSEVIENLMENKTSWVLKVEQLKNIITDNINSKLETERQELRAKKLAELETKKEEKKLKRQELRAKKAAELEIKKEEKKLKRELRAKKKAEREAELAEWRRVKKFADGINIDQDWNYSLVNTTKGNIFRITLDKILLFYAEEKYIIIKHIWDDWRIISSIMALSLNKFEKQLLSAPQQFIRLHRNALVSIASILRVEKVRVDGWNLEEFQKKVINFNIPEHQPFSDFVWKEITIALLTDESYIEISRRHISPTRKVLREL